MPFSGEMMMELEVLIRREQNMTKGAALFIFQLYKLGTLHHHLGFRVSIYACKNASHRFDNLMLPPAVAAVLPGVSEICSSFHGFPAPR
jgi:hypothetical protein